jgi:hypothetical protein
MPMQTTVVQNVGGLLYAVVPGVGYHGGREKMAAAMVDGARFSYLALASFYLAKTHFTTYNNQPIITQGPVRDGDIIVTKAPSTNP